MPTFTTRVNTLATRENACFNTDDIEICVSKYIKLEAMDVNIYPLSNMS